MGRYCSYIVTAQAGWWNSQKHYPQNLATDRQPRSVYILRTEGVKNSKNLVDVIYESSLLRIEETAADSLGCAHAFAPTAAAGHTSAVTGNAAAAYDDDNGRQMSTSLEFCLTRLKGNFYRVSYLLVHLGCINLDFLCSTMSHSCTHGSGRGYPCQRNKK